LQGHPEAGKLWEGMINEILESKEFDFHSTMHERNLYVGTVGGETVLVCRQVDNFAVASWNIEASKKFISMVNEHVTTSFEGMGVETASGMFVRYNGLDVHQTREYCKLNCETYIDRILQTHGWTSPSPGESDRHDAVPMTHEVSQQLQLLEGPAEGTPAHKALEQEIGYSYRQVLGEIVYAYVLCRPDIGYAVTFLSRFSTCPAREHYAALKNICKYLRRTREWGLVYWRQAPVACLPYVPLDQPPIDGSLPPFPSSDLLELIGFVDAAHATDLKTRRSVTGFVFCLGGAAIAYKSKLQATVSTSSTEAEFIAAVHAAKVAKYLRSILKELGFPQLNPTRLFEDNQAAIAMINENKPTPRSRHIDVQHFAIQEWQHEKSIVMHYISTAINPADQATKCLGWVLHSHHGCRIMGHYGWDPTCVLSPFLLVFHATFLDFNQA
jgi:hypothetical protein